MKHPEIQGNLSDAYLDRVLKENGGKIHQFALVKVLPVKGWVEVDDHHQIVVGRLGLKVWNNREDIIAEGFSEDHIMEVVVTPAEKS